MQLDDLRIRAMDGSVLVDGQFALHGDPAAVAFFVVPRLAAIGVTLAPHALGNWKFLGFERIRQGGDGLWAASSPAVTLDLGNSVPPLSTLGHTSFLPADGCAFSLIRRGGLQLGTISLPLAQSNPDKSGSAYLQFGQIDMSLDPVPAGLRIALTAQVTGMIGPEDGPDVTGLTLTGQMVIPALALKLQGQPELLGQPEDPVRNEVSGGQLDPADLGLESFGSLVVEGQVDWGQNGDRQNPLGPFVSLYLADRTMGISPTDRVSRRASGLLCAHSPSSDGPFLRINLGIEDFARMLEHDDHAHISLQGSGIGHILGRTGRDAYEEGELRQEIDWLTLKLERSAGGLLIGGNGELQGGVRGQSARVGKCLDFAMFLPRKLILAKGLKVPRCWDDWKRDHAAPGVW